MPIGIKSGWGQYFVITITGGHENQYHCRYRDIVVPMILTTDSYTVASFPGSCGGGGKRAWYTLFAHAQFPQEFCGFGTSQILRCNIILSMIILSSVTLVVRCPRLMKPCLWSWSQSICRLFAMFMTEKMLLWLPTGFGKSMCYETLPFVFDHKEQSSTSCSSAYCSVVLVVSPLVSLMIRKRRVQGSHLSPLSLS